MYLFFRENKLPVFHVQHISSEEGAAFFLPNTEGVNIYKGVLPKENEQVVIKHTPNSFLNTNLKSLLDSEGIKDLVVCGMMTHMCVDTTVRAAKALGYNVTLIEDSCTTRDLVYDEEVIPATTVQKTYMASLNGIFADIVTADEWIEENSNL